jgi:MFS family permease
MPPVMALLLQAVPASRTGVASGAFNTSRQAGGALAVAVFGALLASRATFLHGLRASLLIAAVVALAVAAVSLLLRPADNVRREVRNHRSRPGRFPTQKSHKSGPGSGPHKIPTDNAALTGTCRHDAKMVQNPF